MSKPTWNTVAILCTFSILAGIIIGAANGNEQNFPPVNFRNVDCMGDIYELDGPLEIRSYKNGKQVGFVNGFSSAVIRTPNVDSFVITPTNNNTNKGE